MSEGTQSIEGNITISELNYETMDPILVGPCKITKELFSSSTDFNLEKFVFDVNQYIQASPLNKETISNILGVFSIVRPKHQELLTKIENAISITHSPMENNFTNIFHHELPFIYELDTKESPIIEFIKNDDFANFQEFVSSKVDFDFAQTFKIEYIKVNLLDVCAYYGSVQCFRYLVCNKAPFSEYVCLFSICGGNYEIIHYLENNYEDQNFDSHSCLDMSIIYHRYELTDWLILNYGAQFTDTKTAILSYNFSVFALCVLKRIRFTFNVMMRRVSYELLIVVGSGNLPIVRYFCEVYKVNKEEKDEDGETALHYACRIGSLSIVQYLCEVAKVNTEENNNYGFTPLQFACIFNHLPIVQYLCEVQKVMKEGALIHACHKELLPIIQYLCEVAKVYKEEADQNGNKPLHIVCEKGSLPIVQYLCEVAKVNKEATNKLGETALHIACKKGYLPIVQYLCEVAKVNKEAKAYLHRTPLHRACEKGYLPIVQYLCEVQKVNTAGAYEITWKLEVRKYLESIGAHK